MALIGAFVSSTLAMMGHAHALKTIGNNVANVNTGGYKRNETHFSSVLSKTLFEQSNLGGIKVKEFQRFEGFCPPRKIAQAKKKLSLQQYKNSPAVI